MIKSRPKILNAVSGKEVITCVFILTIVLVLFDYGVYSETFWLAIVTLILLWQLTSYYKEKTGARIANKAGTLIDDIVAAYTILIVVAFILQFAYPQLLQDRKITLGVIIAFPVVVVPARYLFLGVANHLKLSKERKKYTLVAGVGNLAANVEKQFTGYEVKGYINCKKEDCQVRQDKIVGHLDHLHEYLANNPVDEIVIALPVKPSKKIRNILMAADHYGVRVKYIPDYQNIFGKHYKTKRYGGFEAVDVRQLPLDGTYASLMKKCFDLIFSTFALLFLLPLFILIATLIKLDSAGPIFYCPVRIGKGGKPFKVFKFRSMSQNDNPANGLLSTHKDDPRVTRVGRIMRKYSIDELPQFLNVLLGDMSVVGPRPHRSHLNKQLQETEERYMIRHYFKPGITGWAQVNGWRGPTETKEQKSQRTQHDLWYMENWSFRLDLRIVFMTIFSRSAHKSAF
jgi:Undecaprenyl-phosphate glucose phosphotransferase